MRNNTLDFFKLLAAFFVIVLHVSYDNGIQFFWEVIRLSGRWAVPFFFLVTGVFIALNKKERNCCQQARRIIQIFITASLLFIPVVLYRNIDYFSSISILRLVISGTYFHLWFLSSLALGLFSFQAIRTYYPKLLLPLSVFFLLLYFVADVLSCTPTPNILGRNNDFIRHATSFSFISIGYLIARKGILKKHELRKKYVFIFLTTIALFYIEPFILGNTFTSEVIDRQFPIFTPVISLFILMACFQFKIKESFISEAGNKYSLGIYLVHPLFIFIFNKVFDFLDISNTLAIIFMTFVSSWVLIALLNNFAPFLFRILYGDWRKPRSLSSKTI